MKKLLLLQFRDDISKDHEVACFKQVLGVTDEEFKHINTITDEISETPEELLKDVSAVLLGGSGQYDLSKNPEPIVNAIKKTQKLFDYILENDFPTLGVCFGHQFIASKLGSMVESVKSMSEAGNAKVELTEEGKNDKLFGELPEVYTVTTGHKESVMSLPEGTVLLATNETCPIQAYKYKENIYCMQYHPELNKESVLYRLQMYPEYIEGGKAENSLPELQDTSDASKVLVLFKQSYL
ncbi:MAG: glutamine amidotransferase-related protein [Patescibacteria group bacterium]